MSKCIFIPVKGDPYIVDIVDNDYRTPLKCERVAHHNCVHLFSHRYLIAINYDEDASKGSAPLNRLASEISGSCGKVYGSAIIDNCKKDLTLDDLTAMLIIVRDSEEQQLREIKDYFDTLDSSSFQIFDSMEEAQAYSKKHNKPYIIEVNPSSKGKTRGASRRGRRGRR